MTKVECEQLQVNIIAHCDGESEELINDLCQVVVDYYQRGENAKTTNKKAV